MPRPTKNPVTPRRVHSHTEPRAGRPTTAAATEPTALYAGAVARGCAS